MMPSPPPGSPAPAKPPAGESRALPSAPTVIRGEVGSDQSRATIPIAGGAVTIRGALGTKVGPYEVLEELGVGGMGAVYLARQPELDRTVALKVIHARGEEDRERVQRFLREAQSAARLHHPGIVPIHDVGQDGGLCWYSMERVVGQTFEAWVTTQRPSPRRVLEMVQQVARALAYAHGEGVIHRDVKPQNILVGSDGFARVADFGLAKDLSRESALTQEGTALGTPAYMSPEQADGRSRSIDARTDVYSLGAVLYWALAGRPVFVGDHALEVMARVLSESPVPLRRVAQGVSLDVETICMKCLEKSRERRYATAAALADDVQRWLDGLPISARPPSRAERLARLARRHFALTAAAGVVVVAVCGSMFSRAFERAEQARRAAADQRALDEASRLLDRARARLAAADLAPPQEHAARAAEAVPFLDQAIRVCPRLHAARVLLSGLFLAQGSFRRAAEVDAGVDEPDGPEWRETLYRWQVLGDAIRDAGRERELAPLLVQAAERIERLLAQPGDEPPLDRARVRALLARGRGDEAVSASQAALEHAPESADALHLGVAALVLRKGKELAAAPALLERLGAVRTGDSRDARLRGRVFGTLNQPERAVADWELCVALQPDPSPRDLDELCDAWRERWEGRDEPAFLEALERLAREHPDAPGTSLGLARLHRQAGRREPAARALNEAMRIAPADPRTAAESYVQAVPRDGRATAKMALEGYLKNHPPEAWAAAQGGRALEPLADALLAQGETALADAVLAQALSAAPDDSVLLAARARVCFETGKHDEAATLLDAAIAARPWQPELWFARGCNAHRLRRLDDAERDLLRAVELEPAAVGYRVRLGAHYLQVRQPRSAAEQFAEATFHMSTLRAQETVQGWTRGEFEGSAFSFLRPGTTSGGEVERGLRRKAFDLVTPLLAERLLERGNRAFEAGEDPGAERCWAAAATLAPASAEPYVQLARMHARQESWFTAMACLERAAALAPLDASVLSADPHLRRLLGFPRVQELARKKK